MTADKALREMRERATWHPLDFNPDDLLRWADALEAAMREPVAEIRKSSHDTWCAFDPDLPPGTNLYAFPPDAAAEDRFPQEKTDDRREALRISKLLLKKDAEIERLSHAVRLAASQKLPDEMEAEDKEFADWEHGYKMLVKLARAAHAKEEDK